MKKYSSGTEHKTNEFVDYENSQILKLIDSVQANSLERKDLIAIIRELAFRNTTLEKSLGRF